MELTRYSRQLLIPQIGALGQRRLKNARVLVIGAGGLGSPALLYLAAAGIGTLGILDFDVVEESNLQRQVIHRQSDVGRPKVRSAAATVRELNPLVRIALHEQPLTAANALDIFAGYDLVLDGTDNFATRYLVNDACVLLGKPYVWGSIFRFHGELSVFWARYGPQYRDLYPTPPPPGSVPSCAEGGVFGVLCATIGSLMGTEAIKLITGVGSSLLGRLLVYDALTMTFRTVTLRPDPAAQRVTGLADYAVLCGTSPTGAPVAAAPLGTGAGDLMSAAELKAHLDDGDDIQLIDVRNDMEHDLVHIPGDRLIPQERILNGAALGEIDTARPVVLYCKAGIRSARCLAALRAAGFHDVRHLDGGVLAWVDRVDPALPRY